MIRILKSIIRSISQAIYNDPELRAFFARHPRISSFVKNRLTPDEKFGLNLTVGAIIALFFVFLFFVIVQDLIGQEALIQADLRVINLVQIFRVAWFSKVMLVFTYLAKWQIVVAGLAAISIVFIILRRWYYLLTMLISAGVGELFVWILKNYFDRPRPPLINALAPEMSYSFPSGHAFVAVAFYGLLAYFVFLTFKSKIIRVITILLTIILVIMIGFSRVYLGVHWPSDVLASYVSGIAWLSVLITALEIRRKFSDIEYRPLISRKFSIIISIILSLFFAIFVIGYYISHPLKPAVEITTETTFIVQNDIPAIFNNTPRTSEDITGKPMEPIDIIIVGSQEKLRAIFSKAGWFESDILSSKTLWRAAGATLRNKPYPEAPGVPSFWDSRPNDFAFEKSTPANSIKERHHIHFWETTYKTSEGQNIFFATAHFDQGVKLSSSLIVPTHKIDPAIDKERDFVKQDILNTGDVEKIQEFKIVEPTLGKNQSGDQFFTDGKAYIVYLK